jgi:hypothetical protein
MSSLPGLLAYRRNRTSCVQSRLSQDSQGRVVCSYLCSETGCGTSRNYEQAELAASNLSERVGPMEVSCGHTRACAEGCRCASAP